MLKMSPFLTFLLYCLFVGFTIYYLTKDKLDETSRYMLIGVLILPYIFMDQSEDFFNMNLTNNTNNNLSDNLENFSNPGLEKQVKLEQPIITLNQNEKVENLKALEDVKNRKRIEEEENKKKKISEELKKKTFTLDEVKKLLDTVTKKSNTIENYGSMYNGNVSNSYNEDATFTNQLLKPLGENGNGLTNEWDHDYILLNTDKWAPALNPPPVCKAEKTCPVCPSLTTGYPLMLRDFDSTRRITAPINADIVSMNATDSVVNGSGNGLHSSANNVGANGSGANGSGNKSGGYGSAMGSGSGNAMGSGSGSGSAIGYGSGSSAMGSGSSGSSGSMNNGYVDNVSNGLNIINNRSMNNGSFSLSSIIKSVPESDRPALIAELAKQFNMPVADLKFIYNVEQAPSGP